MTTANNTTNSELTNVASGAPTAAAPVVTAKSPPPEKIKPPHTDARRFATALKNKVGGISLEAQLLQVVTSNADSATADRALRTIAIKATQAIGAAHILSENQLWTYTADRVSGRVPNHGALKTTPNSQERLRSSKKS